MTISEAWKIALNYETVYEIPHKYTYTNEHVRVLLGHFNEV